MSHELAIEVRGLVKRFDEVTALDGVDLEVPAGAFFGLLGPNGAGKTTAVSVITTLTRPTAGSVRVLGRDVVSQGARVRRDLGLVFQECSLDLELTPREQLDLHGRLYHLGERPKRVAEALALAGLERHAARPIRQLSGGMRRRLEIARALIHRPRVLFLDEPTVGLDVASRLGVWDALDRLVREDGATVFLTTHSMQEADTLCQRLAILDRGRVVAEGAPEALKQALGGDVVFLCLETEEGAAARLRRLDGVASVAAGVDGASLRVTIADGPRRLPALLDAARPFGVREVMLHRPTLEHVFLHHTGHAFESGRAEGEALA